MRPRTRDADLPKNVYFRHGAYYLVKRGEWIRVCTRREHLADSLIAVNVTPASRMEILAYSFRALTQARQNARGRRKLPFELTRADVGHMLHAARWRCAVTNTPFSLQPFGPRAQRPYAPSIDRIENHLGYLPGNCRIVCAATNFAMNCWGETVLATLARHMTGRRVLEASNQGIDKAA